MENLKKELINAGASIVGYADLAILDVSVRQSLPFGISIGMALNPKIICGITRGPTVAYAKEYDEVNQKLNHIAEFCAGRLREMGHQAVAVPAYVTSPGAPPLSPNLSRPLAHKTVATLAGLGWIGKCALLVNKEFGSAVRYCSILTDAPLSVGIPITESQCGHCRICVDACPSHAPSGLLWKQGMKRDEFYDAFACQKHAKASGRKIGVERTICGICIAVCPFTQKYLGKSS